MKHTAKMNRLELVEYIDRLKGMIRSLQVQIRKMGGREP